MGYVDQADAKSPVMGLCRERVAKWGQKQLAFLVEAAIICSNGNFNLEPRFKPESFTEYHSKLNGELIDLSKNYRKYRVRSGVPEKRKVSTPPQSISKVRRSHKSRHPIIFIYRSRKITCCSIRFKHVLCSTSF